MLRKYPPKDKGRRREDLRLEVGERQDHRTISDRTKSEGKDGEPDEGRFPRDEVFEAPDWEGRAGKWRGRPGG